MYMIFMKSCVCFSGNIEYKVNDLEYKLRYGDVILIPPDEEHGPIFLQILRVHMNV